MKVLAMLAVLMFATVAVADDNSDIDLAQRTAAAKAKLEARKAAATQASVSDDPAVLRAIILDQKQQIESLKATIVGLNQQIATAKANANAAQAAAALGAAPPKKRRPIVFPVIPPTPSWAVLGEQVRPGDPMCFTKLEIDAVGWLDLAKVDKVIDANTALMEIFLVDPRTGKHDLDTVGPAPGVEVIAKIPTVGLADDTYVHVKKPQYFQITSTQKFKDTTYFVAEPVGEGPKHH